MPEWIMARELPIPMHYHVISGVHGYMPDANTTYLYKRDAVRALTDFKLFVRDTCFESHRGACASGTAREGYTFAPGHGVEYAEIVVCHESCDLEEFNGMV